MTQNFGISDSWVCLSRFTNDDEFSLVRVKFQLYTIPPLQNRKTLKSAILESQFLEYRTMPVLLKNVCP